METYKAETIARQKAGDAWEARGAYVFAGRDCIGICDTDNAPKDRMEANAKLMAAAPDLLIALKTMVETYCDLVNSGDCGFWEPEEVERVKFARAAIAKAEGR